MVVISVEDRRLHVADEVLEERADHNIDDLNYLDVDVGLQSCPFVELLEVHAARDVLLSSCLEELVQGREGEVLAVDRLTEVE